jgi:hypothetical protein
MPICSGVWRAGFTSVTSEWTELATNPGLGSITTYANTTGSSESLAGVNMKIDLSGRVVLGSANFLHR